jgi:peptidoglycan/LPS O-acetylase OafA/YrhL
MKNYPGIEGARGWLAWSVVAWHLVQQTGADGLAPPLAKTGLVASWAVEIFIIISGFVITNLILSKHEPYWLYLARRFLRLFPAYFIALVAGILTTPLWIDAASTMDWLPSTRTDFANLQAVEYSKHFLPNIAAHLTMLHGAIPNEILPASQFMFVGPAWSISLEWQFYIVAPAVIWFAARQWGVALLMAATIVGLIAYNRGALGGFVLPSILFGASQWFAVGITTRMIIPLAPRLSRYPWEIIAVGLLLMVYSHGIFFPLLVWAALVSYMLVEQAEKPKDFPFHVVAILLDSKAARYMGERSYAVYIVHLPVIFVIVYILRVVFGLGSLRLFEASLILAPLVILISSEIIHRAVELPATSFGRRLSRRAPQSAVRTN